MPFIKDLEACQRVAENGLSFFSQMIGEYPTQIAWTLQGKIASTDSENYRLAHRLKQVQAELDSQCNTRFLDLSSENRDLKKKVDELQALQGELNKVNKLVSEQAKQLKELPNAKAERDRARQAEKELKEEGTQMRHEIEQLTEAKAKADKRAATASVAAFQQAVDLTAALTPWVNWAFYDGKNYAKDGKVWLGSEMVFDPALHRKTLEEEEEEEDSPEQEIPEEKTEEPASDEGNPEGRPEAGDA